MVKLTEAVTIPLREAYICGDLGCNTISNRSDCCPICLSEVLCLSGCLSEKRVEWECQVLEAPDKPNLCGERL